jgi:endonuclease G
MTTLINSEEVELKYQNFSAIMSLSRRLPMITACNIDGRNAKKEKRVDVWRYDGRIESNQQWGDAVYDNNILDRGHMVRREDPVWGEMSFIANSDTFHFTNCCPQMAGVNQRIWLGLEDYILQNARVDGMLVDVFTGPYFSEHDLQYRGALIPSSFWKVVAIVTENGKPSATAYKVSQAKELSQLEIVYGAYKTFQISIDSVTKDTQIDFSGLAEFDGFTEYERKTNETLEVKLESADDIRV